MIAATLDANVLVSGFAGFALTESTPGELMRRWRAAAFLVVLSEPIIDEFERALAKPYFSKRLSAERRAADVALLREEARVVELHTRVVGVAADPADDMVIATAVDGGADYLVTGDRALLDVRAYRGISIVSPRHFVDLLAQQ